MLTTARRTFTSPPRPWGTVIAVLAVLASSAGWTADKTSVSVAAPWHVSGLEPSENGYTFLRMEVGETLVDSDVDGRLRPGLATAWSVSDDGLVWTFDLRQDVRFHDGTTLSADAAVASLERARGKKGILAKAPVSSIAGEEGRVVVTLERPYSALPAVLANYSTVVLAPGSFDGEDKVKAFIGTGPFSVAEVEPPLSLKVQRFAEYWGEKPAIQSASYLSSSRAETRALMVESGDADLAFTLDPAGYTRLTKLDGVEVQVKPIPRVITVKLNLGHPALAERDARRALSLAIDRNGIAAGILRFPEAAATQLFPPALGAWHDPALAPLAHDAGEARRLLAGLGWKPGADGILERDGTRFSLTLRTFPNRPELPLIAAALQDQWRQMGVELDVSVGNFAEIPAGHNDGSLDVALYARNYGLTPDPVVNVASDFGVGGGEWGAMNWKAPQVAAALETVSAVSAAEKRAAAIAVVTDALQSELPVIPVVWYQHTVAHNAALERVVVDPLERTYGLSGVRWAK